MDSKFTKLRKKYSGYRTALQRYIKTGEPVYKTRLLRYMYHACLILKEISHKYSDQVLVDSLGCRREELSAMLSIADVSFTSSRVFIDWCSSRSVFTVVDVANVLDKSKVQNVPELGGAILDVLLEKYRRVISSGIEEEIENFGELLRQLLIFVLRYLPDDSLQYIELFRAVVPCVCCGAIAPVSSRGWPIRTIVWNDRRLKVPICERCISNRTDINERVFLLGLIDYTRLLEQYVSKMDVLTTVRELTGKVQSYASSDE